MPGVLGRGNVDADADALLEADRRRIPRTAAAVDVVEAAGASSSSVPI